MLSPKEVLLSVYRGKNGVVVKAIHRATKLSVEMDCHGSVRYPEDAPEAEYCNPNECVDDLKEFCLERLANLVADHYAHL